MCQIERQTFVGFRFSSLLSSQNNLSLSLSLSLSKRGDSDTTQKAEVLEFGDEPIKLGAQMLLKFVLNCSTVIVFHSDFFCTFLS
jgi:hypothetical protein